MLTNTCQGVALCINVCIICVLMDHIVFCILNKLSHKGSTTEVSPWNCQ